LAEPQATTVELPLGEPCRCGSWVWLGEARAQSWERRQGGEARTLGASLGLKSWSEELGDQSWEAHGEELGLKLGHTGKRNSQHWECLGPALGAALGPNTRSSTRVSTQVQLGAELGASARLGMN
jgi:hypothetical protein